MESIVPACVATDVSLGPKTTLGVGGSVSHYAVVRDERELTEAVRFAKSVGLPIIPLGGGSNVIVPDEGLHALILTPGFTTITYEDIDATNVRVRAGAGVVFDALVAEVVRKGLWGIENLSLIPGMVGAVPIQNVGAYGVEAKDVIESTTAYDVNEEASHVFSREACAFEYRSSFFKRSEGKRFIVTQVAFVLSRTPNPRTEYRDLKEHFKGAQNIPLSDIRDAVIHIRKQKFPDWHVLGTAGSFFKNPIITREAFAKLKETYPELPGYPHHDEVKVSLGWILDHVLNLRGYRKGNVGLYEKQALVLVAYNGATAREILRVSDEIREKIFDATRIRVEREVVVLSS